MNAADRRVERVGRRLGRPVAQACPLPGRTSPRRLLAGGAPKDWRGLRRWAHMLGFGGHFLTKTHRHTVTFRRLRDYRTRWRRMQTSGPGADDQVAEHETMLVANFLQFVGAGSHTTGNTMLAAASADLARSRATAGSSEPDTALAA